MSTPKPPVAAATPLLQVNDLQVHFPLPKTGWFAPPEVVRAVDGVSFSARRLRTSYVKGTSS